MRNGCSLDSVCITILSCLTFLCCKGVACLISDDKLLTWWDMGCYFFRCWVYVFIRNELEFASGNLPRLCSKFNGFTLIFFNKFEACVLADDMCSEAMLGVDVWGPK